VIWKRTIVLFWISIAISTLLAAQMYREYRESRPCRLLQKSEIRSIRQDVSFQEAQVTFDNCDVNSEPGLWPKALVLSCFFLWIGFFSSFVQDVFLYVRGRRQGNITGSFRWRR
jgi:hypothetical protein